MDASFIRRLDSLEKRIGVEPDDDEPGNVPMALFHHPQGDRLLDLLDSAMLERDAFFSPITARQLEAKARTLWSEIEQEVLADARLAAKRRDNGTSTI